MPTTTKENQVLNFPAGDAPGIQWRDRKDGERVAYWVAPRKAVAAGFTPRTVQLATGASPTALAQACRRLQAEALEFTSRGNRKKAARFDGSMRSLIRMYQCEPLSGFNALRQATRRVYICQFAILERAIGNRALRALSAKDFDRWYTEFRKPAAAGGPERISRAHYLITMVRMLMKFGVKMEIAEASRLAPVLSVMSFENSAPRTALMTYEMVKAFCAEARRWNRLSLALATAIQFECALRQKDVIGEWLRVDGEPVSHGAAGKEWKIGLRWGEHVTSDLVMTKRTSKSDFRKEVQVDWKHCPLILEQLQYVPPERRIGPLIINEQTGLPYMPLAFTKNWRRIARRAGIPDGVQNMDARSGAITEGSEAGVDVEKLRSLSTHESIKMTQRYNRPTLVKNAEVAAARVAYRAKKGGDA